MTIKHYDVDENKYCIEIILCVWFKRPIIHVTLTLPTKLVEIIVTRLKSKESVT